LPTTGIQLTSIDDAGVGDATAIADSAGSNVYSLGSNLYPRRSISGFIAHAGRLERQQRLTLENRRPYSYSTR
jgi:hypothetical protein